MIDLRFNYPVLDSQHQQLQQALAALVPNEAYLRMEPVGGHLANKQVGADWLARPDYAVDPEAVFITCGGHHALTVLCLAANLSGQSVIVDPLTYNGFIGLALMLGITLIPCPIDNHGMDPAELERLCLHPTVKAVYLTPTIHNPLAFTMPLTRRLDIVDVARKVDVLLIDDDAYGFLDPNAPVSFAHLAPERAFFIYSFAKPIAPGVKTAFMLVPSQWRHSVATVIRSTSSGSVSLFATVIGNWITSGALSELIGQKQQLASQKQALVNRIFEGYAYTTQPTSYHVWLPLHESVESQKVGELLFRQGVDVVTSQAYQVGQEKGHNGLRIALGNVTDEQILEQGLAIVAENLIQ